MAFRDRNPGRWPVPPRMNRPSNRFRPKGPNLLELVCRSSAFSPWSILPDSLSPPLIPFPICRISFHDSGCPKAVHPEVPVETPRLLRGYPPGRPFPNPLCRYPDRRSMHLTSSEHRNRLSHPVVWVFSTEGVDLPARHLKIPG